MSKDYIRDLFDQVQNNISGMAEYIEFETSAEAIALLANCYLAQIKLAEITSKIAVATIRNVYEPTQSSEP